MFLRIAILMLLVVSVSASCAEVPAELRGFDIVKLWQFDQTEEGWYPDHNVSPFTVKDGAISFNNTGFDPWISFNPSDEIDVSRCGFFGFRMRSSVSGDNQIYFTTDQSPNPAANGDASCWLAGDDKFHLCQVNMAKLPTWRGKLALLRIDPVNGGYERVAKVEIDWIALYQSPAKIQLARPELSKDLVNLPVCNTGGTALEAGMVVTADGVKVTADRLEPGQKTTVTIPVKGTGKTVEVVGKSDDKTMFRALLNRPSGASGTDHIISNTITKLSVNADQAVISVIAGAGEKPMGVFHPLATLAYRDSSGAIQYVEMSADSVVRHDARSLLLRSKRDVAGGSVRVEWSFTFPKGSKEGQVNCRLTSDKDLDILRFEGPRLLAGEGSFGSSKTHALLPGLEYLESSEQSSSPDNVGITYADRRVPHPYKITVPTMAVEAGGAVVGLSWDPMRQGDGRGSLCAGFESPNKGLGQSNHLLTLFAPSVGEYLHENDDLASQPYHLAAGSPMQVSFNFFARPGSITDVVPYYFAAHGLPKSPPIAHGVEGTIDLCLKGYTDTLYSARRKGWKTHFGIKLGWGPNAVIASSLVAESLRQNRPELAEECGLSPDAQLSEIVGKSLDWFTQGAKDSAAATMKEQSEDGGFPYVISDEMRAKVRDYTKSTGQPRDTIGEPGATCSGLIATKLLGLLSYALTTGDETVAAQALKGLAKMNSFTVPRGASTWEVPLMTPDLISAGYAIQCNILGYQLTGDQRYMDSAKFWAYTGLPFIYSWIPPIDPRAGSVLHYAFHGEGSDFVAGDATEFYDNTVRYVNPGASVPEFGTSFYVGKWFGQPVQWCGLAWANAVHDYLRLRPDPVLQRGADNVFASATQQQVEKGFLAGCYTDVWGIEPTGNSPVFIYPQLIYQYACALAGEKEPYVVDSLGFEMSGKRSYLNTYAIIENFKVSGNSLSARLKYYGGQDLYTGIAAVEKPAAVSVEGKQIAEVTDLAKAPSGWFYDQTNRALHIKYRSAKRVAQTKVRWP